jgi:hypothetical protein
MYGIAQLGTRYTSPYRYSGVGFPFLRGDARYPIGDAVMRLRGLTVDIEEYGIAQLSTRHTSPYRYSGVGFLFFEGR